ncbi:hypothetical protein FNV43_RR10027 [Rhamnella rubrinervis]|uniref:Ubiquitin-like protease family profile domain-containing protein n=1 Tax=Rhamnella rubrinervis TaxID=2594499 RepID=A0A8K0MKC3_9ROSA|nr:hypothetical protein FNV43_RR10027 [Rhamnella rubrinervis]
MALSKRRLVKASEKQVSSKQSTTNQNKKTKQATTKENPQATKRVVPDTPISLLVEKKSRGNVEEQAPVSTTTNIAPQQSHPIGWSKWPILAQIVHPNQTYQIVGPTGLLAVECDDKYVMEFDFNGIGARFDRKCFAMITGLNCGKFPHNSELDHLSYDLWTKFFSKRGPMTQGEFSKAFEDLDFDEKEVADNVKCCMRHPWGNLSYDATIPSLRFRIKRGHEIANYSIWGFQTIHIVTTIGPRGKYHGSNWIARMLAWSCPSILQYTKLATAIFTERMKYYGPPVFRVKASKSQLPVLPSLAIEGMKDASQSKFQHTLRLEMQIEEIRIWDPFTPIDPTERAALFAFIDDPSTTVHLGDYDALEKSSFQLILISGSWLGDMEMDASLFYIRRRMINSPQMYDQRAIVTDCMFWRAVQHTMGDGKEDELSNTADWKKEMKDLPFDMYALGTLPIISNSWLEVDYVYVLVNNDNKH